MASLRKLAALSGLLAALFMAGSAVAHTLEVPRASKANKTFAKALCAATDDPAERCVSSSAGPCSRISEHRVRCSIFITIEAADKSQGRCLALMEWSIRNKSPALRPTFLGIRSCSEVRPPQPTPVP